VLVTPCPERLSNEEKHRRVLEEYCRYPSKDLFGTAVKNGETDLSGVNAAVAQAIINEIADTTIVSNGLTKQDCDCLGVEHEDTLDAALGKCLAKHGDDAKVIIMTHGPKVVPVY
jgi:hypothetical protein